MGLRPEKRFRIWLGKPHRLTEVVPALTEKGIRVRNEYKLKLGGNTVESV